MIGFVMVGTNDLDKATVFYDTLLDIIDLKRIEKTDTYGSYAPKSNPEAVEFYVTTPFNEDKATVGNGTVSVTNLNANGPSTNEYYRKVRVANLM